MLLNITIDLSSNVTVELAFTYVINRLGLIRVCDERLSAGTYIRLYPSSVLSLSTRLSWSWLTAYMYRVRAREHYNYQFYLTVNYLIQEYIDPLAGGGLMLGMAVSLCRGLSCLFPRSGGMAGVYPAA